MSITSENNIAPSIGISPEMSIGDKKTALQAEAAINFGCTIKNLRAKR